jgi:hypothetical protein
MDTRRFLVITALLTLIPPAASQGQPPAPDAVSNLSSVVRGGLVEVSYDLTTDNPSRRFSVALTVSDDGGQTFEIVPRTVSGDVGATVAGGTGKRITWEAARDVETIELGSLRYRVVATPVPLPSGVAAVLEVTSRPSGATVSVDDALRGQTPLRLDDLPPGEYRVIVTRDGYLEHTQVVTLLPAATDTISVTLTAVAATQPVVEDSGGGSKLKWILPLVGGAGAAAALAASSTAFGGGPVPETLVGQRITEVLSGEVSTGDCGLNAPCRQFLITTTTRGQFDATLEWTSPPQACIDLDLVITENPNGMQFARTGNANRRCTGSFPPLGATATLRLSFIDRRARTYRFDVLKSGCLIGSGIGGMRLIADDFPFITQPLCQAPLPVTLTVVRPR